eukprot:scaffold183_cov174-Ochromonas_danica.AAC.7
MLCLLGSRAFRHSWKSPVIRGLISQLSINAGSRFLEVPFQDNSAVKALGGRWDGEAKKWFIPDGIDEKAFNRWRKIYLQVPFEKKDQVKKLGASWDRVEGKWFITGGQDTKPFLEWMDESDIKNISNENQNQEKTAWTKANNNNNINNDNMVKTGDSASASPAAGYSQQSITTPTATAVAAVAAAKSSARKDTVLIVDCDTNGLPTGIRGNIYPPYTTLRSYDTARIVQLSYALCNRLDYKSLTRGSFIIRSDGFPIENTQFHGISQQTSLTRGVAAKSFMEAVLQTNVIVAHNADFVINIIKSEFFRHALLDDLAVLDSKKEFCSMLGTRDFMKLKDKQGNPKAVSLKELVLHALDEDLPQMHNSEVDVQYLRRALQKLAQDKSFEIGELGEQ